MRTFEFEALNLLVEDDGNHVWHRNGHKYKIQTTKAGYKQIQSVLHGSRHTYMVHRLVALAFIPNPENKPEVNHIDGNKANNHYSNLEWVSKQENMDHAKKFGHWNKDMGREKYIPRDMAIMNDLSAGLNRTQLCEKYGLKRPNINRIIRENW